MNSVFSQKTTLVTYIATLLTLSFGFSDSQVNAQDAKLQQALGITPKQSVKYEKPGIAVLKECKFAQRTNPPGFVVHHSSGRMLRQFLDTNSDGKLDQWSYYDQGQEVYRDVDKNYDGKTDQYRWLGEAGSRWGLDNNQDGNIDAWKSISAEEVAYECFQAIKNKDQDRFNLLLLTPTEFNDLQLGIKVAKDIQGRWEKARTGFMDMARKQNSISAKSKWVYAGNGWPSMMAAGENGKKDILIYNHGAGFYDPTEGGKTNQLSLGSLVRVGDVWRMVEMPEIYDGKSLGNGGAFFPVPGYGGPNAPTATDKELAGYYDQLADIETRLPKAKGIAIEKAEKEKAAILEKFVEATADPKNKIQWVETLADSVSSAYQADRYEGGVAYLRSLEASKKNWPAMDYVSWRAIFAEYGWFNTHGDKRQREKAHDQLVASLKTFVGKYTRSKFAPDALIQLAVSYEVSDPDEPAKALEWYKLCQSRYAATSYGKRAAGAIKRLGSFGKPLAFQGTTSQGQAFNLSRYNGKIVVLHFWQTWCDDGIKELASIADKFKEDVVLVSCNIESVVDQDGVDVKASTEKFKAYLQKNRETMTWIQLHAPGGVDESPLAHQLGVATEPMVALIDKKGRLVETNIAFGTLEREIVLERRRKD